MTYLVDARRLANALTKHGLVPPQCYRVELIVGLGSAMALRFETYVTEADLPKIAAALDECGRHAVEAVAP